MSKKHKTNVLALSGVMLAVTLLFNFIASLHLLRIDAVFFLLSGALVYFVTKRNGIRVGIAFYVAASLLSFVIVPDKAYIMLFIGVFGPCAIIQMIFFYAESKERIGQTLSAIFSILVFIILFFLFAFLIAYGGGFLVSLDLPALGTTIGMVVASAFGIISAIVAFIVNRNLSELIERRLGGSKRVNKADKTSQRIDLPKLYQESDE